MADQPTVTLDSHRVALTNLDKVMYPKTGTTKADVVGYYAAVTGVMIPHLMDRPATRKRWPDGVDAKPFFEKNLGNGVPGWVTRREIQHSDRLVSYPLVDSAAALVWLGQSAALELHVPQWCFGPRGAHRNPDRLVFDLDPGPGATLAECAVVARAVREVLGRHGSALFPVTSGSKGLHLYLGLNGAMSSPEASEFAHRLAETVEKRMPDLVVSRMSKALRPGKVFIDWSQNNGNKTTIAPYSLRGRDEPMVAAPRTWDELDDPALTHLDFQQVLDRIAAMGDPMAELGHGLECDGAATLDAVRAAVERAGGQVRVFFGGVGGHSHGQHHRTGRADPPAGDVSGVAGQFAGSGGSGGVDRLARYRSMRSADRTPEPVPAPGIQPQGNDDTFVIQEHHARRLHWDLRLEREGVLVSWAVPRGIPTDVAHNRLAVHTEDHPLEYATFSGSIPRGEYGGGQMFIWDAGTYDTEKWRDDEVIVVLHGSKAAGRYALIQTGGTNWLLHRMKDQSPEPHHYGPESPASPGASGPAESSDPAPAAPRKRAGATARPVGAAARPVAAPNNVRAPAESAGATAESAAGTAESAGRQAISRLPEIAPMLAVPGTVEDVDGRGGSARRPESLPAWRFDAKWDGIRAIASVADGQVSLRSRAGNDLTASYPELLELGELLVEHSAVLDGEIVALGANGAPHFGTLQRRMGVTKRGDVAAARREVEVLYYVFDVLHLDGVSLLRKTFDDRRRVLEAMRLHGEHVAVPEQLAGPAARALRDSDRRHLEGIVAKRADSTYDPGKRSGAWVKIKLWRTQDVVVVGWRPGAGRRSGGIGSLLLGVHGPAGLEYAGRVGTGFTDAALDALLERLKTMQRKTSAVASTVPREDAKDAIWVRPELVGEVEYSEITGDHRLRQASWRGLRDDVPIGQVQWDAVVTGRPGSAE